jgi:hypothetical protein
MASAALFSWYTEACVAAKGFVVFPSLLIAAQIKYAIKMPTKNHTGLFIWAVSPPIDFSSTVADAEDQD